jgi:hypothetical protein
MRLPIHRLVGKYFVSPLTNKIYLLQFMPDCRYMLFNLDNGNFLDATLVSNILENQFIFKMFGHPPGYTSVIKLECLKPGDIAISKDKYYLIVSYENILYGINPNTVVEATTLTSPRVLHVNTLLFNRVDSKSS